MRRALRNWTSGAITLAMIVFAQMCAIHDATRPTPVTDTHAAATATPEESSSCSGDGCGGGEPSPCPRPNSCCSTWGRPATPLLLDAPQAALAHPFAPVLAETASAVSQNLASSFRLFEIVRPPGFSAAAHHPGALSRRGPPLHS